VDVGMSAPRLESVQVMRGHSGPFPGARLGDAIAYEFELDRSLVPRPGTTRLERVFVLLDVGVQLSNPPYWHGRDAACWYVDLVAVSGGNGSFTVWDQYVDLIVATDGRPYRMLDLDEFAAAVQGGALSWPDAVDGLRRWQRFLDRYLHGGRFPAVGWTDFPPAVIGPLAALPAPLSASVTGSP
jgi:Protein of unknown function (DUF402)